MKPAVTLTFEETKKMAKMALQFLKMAYDVGYEKGYKKGLEDAEKTD